MTTYELVRERLHLEPPALDAEQQQVVDHAGGPLLALAGPGTGKTTTLVEAIVRRGDDVRVIDAKTSEDLTQATLTQIILESGRAARLLPVTLLQQLIRMDDESLAEFMGRYLSATLEMYLEAKRGAQSVSPFLPMATMPFQAANAIARMWLGAGQAIAPEPQYVPPATTAPAAPPPARGRTKSSSPAR